MDEGVASLPVRGLSRLRVSSCSLAALSLASLVWLSSVAAAAIFFSQPFNWSAILAFILQMSVVPLDISFENPSLTSFSAVCSFLSLSQTSFILSLSLSIILVHLSNLSWDAVDLLIPSGVADLLLPLESVICDLHPPVSALLQT